MLYVVYRCQCLNLYGSYLSFSLSGLKPDCSEVYLWCSMWVGYPMWLLQFNEIPPIHKYRNGFLQNTHICMISHKFFPPPIADINDHIFNRISRFLRLFMACGWLNSVFLTMTFAGYGSGIIKCGFFFLVKGRPPITSILISTFNSGSQDPWNISLTLWLAPHRGLPRSPKPSVFTVDGCQQ